MPTLNFFFIFLQKHTVSTCFYCGAARLSLSLAPLGPRIWNRKSIKKHKSMDLPPLSTIITIITPLSLADFVISEIKIPCILSSSQERAERTEFHFLIENAASCESAEYDSSSSAFVIISIQSLSFVVLVRFASTMRRFDAVHLKVHEI